MNYTQINNSLKRPLQSGHTYNHYFQNSSCTPTYLGKSDTAFTVRQMVQMANKNLAHTKQLSLNEFAGQSLQHTCENIHHFLFNHIQYELDKEDQHLRSPACTWATRDEGTDCKSYSIFASTILSNLGIKHYLRRVKQPNPDFRYTQEGINPDLWTHVYVVVPKNQQSMRAENPHDYFIIDATIASNIEVAFLQKDDTKMRKVKLKHYGLQAPQPYKPNMYDMGMGACSCHSATPIISNRGFDPITSDFSGGLRSSNPSKSTSFGEDFAKYGLTLFSAAQQGAANQNASTSQGSREQQLAAIGQSGAISSLIYGGGTAAAAATGGLSLLASLIPAQWLESTVGQLFEGFDCIGSSWTPKKAKKTFEIEVNFLKQEIAQTIQSFNGQSFAQIQDLINQFYEHFYSIQSVHRDWYNTTARDCTRRGLEVLFTSLDSFKELEVDPLFKEVINATGHFLVPNGTKTVTYPPHTNGKHALTQAVPQFAIQINTSVLPNADSQSIPSNASGSISNTTKAVGVAAVAALALAFI